MHSGTLTSGRSKKDKWLFSIVTLLFALHIPPSIVAAGYSVTFLAEPVSSTTPFSFLFFRWAVMIYLIICPGALLWGCITPWLFHKQGSEIRIKHHLFVVFLYCLPLFFAFNGLVLRLWLSR
jgi:hypothetical protein